jgi:anthranilate synthase component 1
MVRPDRDEFRALAERGAPIPLVREVLADLDTPLSAFLKIDDGETAFLFESMEGGELWSRYSFIGVGSRARFIARGGRVEIRRRDETRVVQVPPDRSRDPLWLLRELLEELRPIELPGLPTFAGGAVGFLSYDWVRYVERLPDANPDRLGVPDCFFNVPEVVLIHDRREHSLLLVAVAEPRAGESADQSYAAALARIDAVLDRLRRPTPAAFEPESSDRGLVVESNVTRERYHEMVKRAKEYIQAGDIFQVVPSQRLRVPLRVDPIWIYRQLRVINPSPYLFFLRADGAVALGSSPEVLVKLERGEIRLRPIAGTFPRADDPEEDARRAERLRADPKERAEHLMLVDLGRNDVGRVAQIGTVEVTEFEAIERYSHVMHLVSEVRGKLRPECDAIDVLRASFPAGTLTGAPKVRAMEIIDELESERRGLYGGSVGYLDFRGNMDMCIAIRTLWIQDDWIVAQAGGGVVADSDPETEYQETLAKARALLYAIERAGGGEPA